MESVACVALDAPDKPVDILHAKRRIDRAAGGVAAHSHDHRRRPQRPDAEQRPLPMRRRPACRRGCGRRGGRWSGRHRPGLHRAGFDGRRPQAVREERPVHLCPKAGVNPEHRTKRGCTYLHVATSATLSFCCTPVYL